MPKIFGAKGLSADEIAVLLGFADAAAMVAEIGQYCVAGGTTNAYTATPAIPWTDYVDGQRITVRIPNFVNTGASTINVSGLGAKNIYKMSQGANVQLTGYELYYGHMATLVYSGLAGGFILESSFSLRAADIPSTLNATTFGGDITLPLGGGVMGPSGNTGYTYFCGGVAEGQANGAYISLSGVNWNGDASYYTGNNAGAAHSFFDKNGAGQLVINEYGLLLDSIGGYNGQRIAIGPVSAADYGGNGAAQILLHASGHATYPGAHQQFAPLSTRAASTAIALCPVATGDTAMVEIQETTIAGCIAFVDAAGTVTLFSPVGGTVSASIVNSSSPGATEYGVYISAGVLYFKGGSSYAGKMASFSKIGKA